MPSNLPRLFRFLLAVLVLAAACSSLAAMDRVTVNRDGQQVYVNGRVVLKAEDGGLLFLARDGVLWRILPKEIVARTSDDKPFRAYPAEEMTRSLLAELPKGFEVYETAHYLIAYDTSKAYAQWCGSLFERLYAAFRNAWAHQKVELVDPEFRLVAVVFSDKASYVKYAQKDLGAAADSIFGYYDMESNRMTMYDLVGVAVHRPGRSIGQAQINQFLASPNGPAAVSTIVHEATHQIAFNSGLHQRLSDCPKWFSEGIAMYCETPDLGRKGWAGIGVVNRGRLEQFLKYRLKRPADSLTTLISNDKRLLQVEDAVDAYAESWALTYFLIHKHPKQYIAYLKVLARKRPLEYDEKTTRIAEFEKQFGPLPKIETEFTNFVLTYLR